MGSITEALRKIGAREAAGGSYYVQKKTFEPKPEKGAKAPEVSRAKAPSSSAGSSNALVETSFASRTYWPDEVLTSTDGAFTWIVKPVRRVNLQGGDWIDFADPTP